jgi:hypothetical protein
VSEAIEDISLELLQNEANHVFPKWAVFHESDFIKVIPSSPNDEHQDISVVSFEAIPSLEIARQIGYMGLGMVSETIVEDLQRLGIVDLTKKRIAERKSVLFSNLHLTSVLDAAASHNQLFVATEDVDSHKRNRVDASPSQSWPYCPWHTHRWR